MNPTAGFEDISLRKDIANGSETAFEKLFKLYYSSLAGYAFNILKDKDLAEGTVLIHFGVISMSALRKIKKCFNFIPNKKAPQM